MIQFDMKTELEDYINKRWHVFSHTLLYRIYTLLVILIALVYTIVLTWHEQSLSEYVFAIVVVFVLAVMALKFLKSLCVSVGKTRKDFPISAGFTFTEEGLRVKTPTIEVFLPWEEVVRIRETDKYILFDKQYYNFVVVYKQLISSEVVDSIMTFLHETATIAAKIESYSKTRALVERIYNSIISHM